MCLNLDIFLKIRNDFRSISSSSGCSQSSSKITRCSPAKAGSWRVFIFSPDPDWQQAISLPSESGQRQTRRQWTGGEEFSFRFRGKHYNCWTNIFHIWTFKEGGRNNSMSSFLFNFELKWLLRTKRTWEHRGRWSGDSELGWEYLSLNKQDVRARDNDRCSIMLRTGAGHQHSQHFYKHCPA